MVRPGFEPGTFCVLDRCDNQLRHRTASILRGVNRPKYSLNLFGLLPWLSLASGYVSLFYSLNRALDLEKVINKAGGLVYQRNFAGAFCLLWQC